MMYYCRRLLLGFFKQIVTYWDFKGKFGTFISLRLHRYGPIKLLKDHFRDSKSQSHTSPVDIFGFSDFAEKPEKFV